MTPVAPLPAPPWAGRCCLLCAQPISQYRRYCLRCAQRLAEEHASLHGQPAPRPVSHTNKEVPHAGTQAPTTPAH
jgi:predicted amidophosphoribosyltransferase